MQKKIVIIDDDTGIITVLSSILEEAGYAVTPIANNFEDLSPAFDHKIPNLFLIDAFLQQTNAAVIINKIKEKAKKRIPIILMSAYPEAEELAHDAFVDDFLIKPFHIKTLMDKVRFYDEQQDYEKYGIFHQSIGSTKR